jgi:hypothetical protein
MLYLRCAVSSCDGNKASESNIPSDIANADGRYPLVVFLAQLGLLEVRNDTTCWTESVQHI